MKAVTAHKATVIKAVNKSVNTGVARANKQATAGGNKLLKKIGIKKGLKKLFKK